MSKFLVIVLVGFLALQVAVAKPKAKQAQEPSQIQQLAAKAEQAFHNVTAAIEGNLPDSKQVIDTVSTGAQNLVDHFQTFADKIKTELKNNQGDIENVLKTVSEKLQEAKVNIQNSLGPDGQKKAQDIKNSIDKGLKDAVSQIDKLGKAVEPEAKKVREDLQNAAKVFLDNVIEVSNDLQDKLKKQH
ncbi:uncharacterized protein [Leptinotarsa decemlineata]|uniref:uncharacterized protein n=1 Tax=Leptinotarsa decemlineata TaxID=7539 RepID=UPI003D306446